MFLRDDYIFCVQSWPLLRCNDDMIFCDATKTLLRVIGSPWQQTLRFQSHRNFVQHFHRLHNVGTMFGTMLFRGARPSAIYPDKRPIRFVRCPAAPPAPPAPRAERRTDQSMHLGAAAISCNLFAPRLPLGALHYAGAPALPGRTRPIQRPSPRIGQRGGRVTRSGTHPPL